MSEEARLLEENVARLIRAAHGPSARPSPQAREQTFQLLLSHVRARSMVVDFPDVAVGLLGAVLAVVEIWLVVQVVVADTSFIGNPSLLVMAAVLMLNLALVPIASIVIVVRRQNG